jgi:magnesium transporter
LSDDFWKELKAFGSMADEQIKHLKTPHKRSFVDEHRDEVFWTIMRPIATEDLDALEVVNFYMRDRLLVTRQFSEDDAFSKVVHKLMAQGDEIATGYGMDRLAADLMRGVVHSYYDVLSLGGARLESLQNRIIRHPGKEELHMINRAQQTIWIFLKSVWPLEGIIVALSSSRCPLLSQDARQDLTVCQNEVGAVLRIFETYRNMSYDIMNVYVSGLGLKTNEISKVLTVIATLFLPPTLIAGIYGMNFQIPEVNIAFGYPICLMAMFAVSGGLLIWLKSKDYIDFL